MDCKKVGKLILDLRKENKMTQKMLAEALHLSDKTISKWERGLGCPDVSLLGQLSSVFKVDIEKILLGDLEPSTPEVGNMKKTSFYVCKSCGNILLSSSAMTPSCCGRKLSPLEAQSAEENHGVRVEEIENDYFLSFDHPMSKGHYISFVSYVTPSSVLLMKLYPEQSPSLRFPRIFGGKLYYYCTEHGLFLKESMKNI
ncbi:MAG: helix-turn-helix domain-containing protein [Clostridia bacterium]|nr:helix-turn-helix domain-containing protein [Clostridia bacterium]